MRYLIQRLLRSGSNDIQQGGPDGRVQLMEDSQAPHHHGSLLGSHHCLAMLRLSKQV